MFFSTLTPLRVTYRQKCTSKVFADDRMECVFCQWSSINSAFEQLSEYREPLIDKQRVHLSASLSNSKRRRFIFQDTLLTVLVYLYQ